MAEYLFPEELQAAAAAKGLTIAPDPYDVGYFMRYLGWPKPSGGRRRDGWVDCNQEIKAEGRADG